ncbi:hypothetical protein MTP99_015683 [Tenebrio molitor]|jgi:hypothetical protein|nr:hypothetical protein MTP99_015683 [Tenebrio molitor]
MQIVRERTNTTRLFENQMLSPLRKRFQTLAEPHISTLSQRVYIYTSTVTEINQSECACIDSGSIRANLSGAQNGFDRCLDPGMDVEHTPISQGKSASTGADEIHCRGTRGRDIRKARRATP